MAILKKGFYLAVFAGCSGSEAILWSDGKSLFSHGSSDPVSLDLVAYIAEDPIDLRAIPCAYIQTSDIEQKVERQP